MLTDLARRLSEIDGSRDLLRVGPLTVSIEWDLGAFPWPRLGGEAIAWEPHDHPDDRDYAWIALWFEPHSADSFLGLHVNLDPMPAWLARRVIDRYERRQ